MARIALPESLTAPPKVGRALDQETIRGWYTPPQWAALERGEILIAGGEGEDTATLHRRRHRATAIIAHTPEQVWLALTDFESRPRFLPGAKEIRIVRLEGNKVWLDERVRLPLLSIHYRVINTLEPELGSMSWILDKSAPHDIADTDGGWLVSALDGGSRTLVTYRVRVDTGQPLPGFLENLLVKRSLPDLIAGLRHEVERRFAPR
ncbi:MAG TPA: SRPBCC family protein [Terriglobales bacterium]|nr:SRPBCC family protein [Terriglobales bacterium]